MKNAFTYQDVKLRQGWQESNSCRYDEIIKFLATVTGEELNPYDDEDLGNFFQEVSSIQGPRNGKASQKLSFKGITFKVTRKPIKTIHSSEASRWSITVKKC